MLYSKLLMTLRPRTMCHYTSHDATPVGQKRGGFKFELQRVAKDILHHSVSWPAAGEVLMY
jgi:hypothetical protein